MHPRTQVGLTKGGAALCRWAVGWVVHGRHGLALLEVLVLHAANGVGCLHCSQGPKAATMARSSAANACVFAIVSNNVSFLVSN
jgi:hypothetical protein